MFFYANIIRTLIKSR